MIEDVFQHQLGIFAEDIQLKFDLAIEGQQMFSERIDRVDLQVDKVKKAVESVAASLTAHRHDTEAHRGYQVQEN